MKNYGVPIRIRSSWVKKVPKRLDSTVLKEMHHKTRERDVRRERIKEVINGLLNTKNVEDPPYSPGTRRHSWSPKQSWKACMVFRLIAEIWDIV